MTKATAQTESITEEKLVDEQPSSEGAAAGSKEAIAADPDSAKPLAEHAAATRDKNFAFISRTHAEVSEEDRALTTKLGLLLLHLERCVEMTRDYLGEQISPAQTEIDAKQKAEAEQS